MLKNTKTKTYDAPKYSTNSHLRTLRARRGLVPGSILKQRSFGRARLMPGRSGDVVNIGTLLGFEISLFGIRTAVGARLQGCGRLRAGGVRRLRRAARSAT